MVAVNTAVDSVLGAVLRPLWRVSPLAGVVALSLVTAIAALLIFKRLSNQAQLARAKRAIEAGFFEIRLFNDERPDAASD